MAIRIPYKCEFVVPLLTTEEIVVAIDQNCSGKPAQTQLSSLQWVAAEIEVRIAALREV